MLRNLLGREADRCRGARNLRGGVRQRHARGAVGGAHARERVSEQGARGCGARDASKHHAVQQAVPAQTVAPVDAARNLARGEQPGDGLASRGDHFRGGGDCEAAHAVWKGKGAREAHPNRRTRDCTHSGRWG